MWLRAIDSFAFRKQGEQYFLAFLLEGLFAVDCVCFQCDELGVAPP